MPSADAVVERERISSALASLAMARNCLLPDYEEQAANQALRHIDDAMRILRGERVDVVETRATKGGRR